MMNYPVKDAKYRILVTGSRGKSSLVRLLFSAIAAQGLNVRARITGVLPRELTAAGERLIVRNAPGHVEEMRWWLRQIPAGTEAVVMENSAVHPGLQPLAARWLRPTLVIWTNARSDHQEVWGAGRAAAEEALLSGIPQGIPLIAGAEITGSPRLKKLLAERRTQVIASDTEENNFRRANLLLARRALEFIGLSGEEPRRAMELLPPDIGDFRVFSLGGGACLASAFSANDACSTEHIFSLLGWNENETSVLFSDRGDRPLRRASFGPFLNRGWRETKILTGGAKTDALYEWLRGKKVFGCGNIAGVPLGLLQRLIEERCEWTIPGG